MDNQKYKFQYVSKIHLLNKEFDKKYLYLSPERDFIQSINLFDKQILICDSKNIKIYNYPSFHLATKIISKSNFFSATLLKSKDLACCEYDGCISFYSMENSQPILKQRLYVLKGKTVYRIKELINNMLVSCQDAKFISFYEYDKNKYNMKQKININNFVENIFYTKDNDILLYKNVFFPNYHYEISLFDFEEMKIKKNILSCEGNGLIYEPFKFLNKDIVAIIIKSSIFLIDINQDYCIITNIKTEYWWFNCICAINNNYLITGDKLGNIILWKFENKQLYKKCVYKHEKKEKVYYLNCDIKDILHLGNNLLFVGGIYNGNKYGNSGYISDLFEIIEYKE